MSEDRCKKTGITGEGQWGWMHPHQCKFKVWKEHPEDGLCKIHHPITQANRDKAMQERWAEEKKRSPYARIELLTKQRDALLVVANVTYRAIILGNGREIDWNTIADSLKDAIALCKE